MEENYSEPIPLETLAGIFSMQPEVLILDETFSSLDAVTASVIEDLLFNLNNNLP